MRAAQIALSWTERGRLPDAVVRAGIRHFLRIRLAQIQADDVQAAAQRTEEFVAAMEQAPIALQPDKANEQHYEVPAAFYSHVLGEQRKYSACYWPNDISSLDEAESAALLATCERAGLGDGMQILELGCGWGSLTLWIAQHYPNSNITAVCNSHSQRMFILAEAARRQLCNIEVITRDMNEFDTLLRFDRVISVEMFEHMRNWRALMKRVHEWLRPGGLFFMHVFVHRLVPYSFDDRDESDWMSRHFFSGGMMPSDDLALRVRGDLELIRRWRWDGTHYEKTSNAWLANLDAHREQAVEILAAVHGAKHAAGWLQRWRIFLMACAELFGYDGGRQWWVSHYLFQRSTG